MNAKEWLIVPGGIAEQLKALHEQSRLSGKELADRLGWAQSKVTRVRQGQVTPTPADVVAWAHATGAESRVDDLLAVLEEAVQRRVDWRQRMQTGHADVQRDYNGLVAESTTIRYFEMAWIPGFLQTRDYARHVLRESHELHGGVDDVEEAVTERLRRHQFLLEASKQFELLIAEPVLYWDSCPPGVLRPQLHFLLTWLDAPNVRLGVLPMKGGNRWTPQNSFQVYDDLVIVEMFDGEVNREPGVYLRVLKDMWEVATTGDQARQIIERAIAALPT